MPKNPNIGLLDTAQLSRSVIDHEHDAVRIMYAHDHTTEFALNAQDDSITVHAHSETWGASVHDVRSFKTVCVYVKNPATVQVEVSPHDEGDDWWRLAELAAPLSGPLPICARRMRITAPEGAEVSVVGQN